MASYGKLEAFRPYKDNWVEYEEQSEQFFIANGIDDGKRKGLFSCLLVGKRPTVYTEAYWLHKNQVTKRCHKKSHATETPHY